MRCALAVAAVLVLLVPAASAGPFSAGDGPLVLTLQVTDHGSPVAGSLWASELVDGTWRYAEETLDSTGAVTLHLWPGDVNLHLRGPSPDDLLLGSATLHLDADVDVRLDLSPGAATVPIDLSIVDQDGQPLPRAEILPQMLFGSYLCIGRQSVTMTATAGASSAPQPAPPGPECDLQWSEPGHLVGQVPPGVLLLRASTTDHASCLVAYSNDDREPCMLYGPKSLLLPLVDGQPVTASVALGAIPPPDAVVEGYLMSNVTGKAIPRKNLSFRGTGEFSSVYFDAYLDEDGSYRLGIPAGNYTVSAFVCGHDGVTLPFTATKDSALRMDILLPRAAAFDPTWTSGSAGGSYTNGQTGGSTAFPDCDVTPTTQPAPGAAEDASRPDARDETTASEPDAVPVTMLESLAVANFNGGLGPFGGVLADAESPAAGDQLDAANGNREGGGIQFSPGTSFVAALASIAGLALALRRRLA